MRARLDDRQGATQGASSLTAAELRLLPLLSTHLTFDEIGDRLSIKRTTVKTHTRAIYRKFGVPSRRAAVSRMHELGLLPTNEPPRSHLQRLSSVLLVYSLLDAPSGGVRRGTSPPPW